MGSAPSDPSADAAQVSYEAGDILADKYRLVRCVGRGAFGVVWVAENLALAGEVAIKLFTGHSAGGKVSERFLREARAMARLNHAGIVRVFDFGQTREAVAFIVMELLVGESLEALIAREGRLEAKRAVAMMLPLAEALAAAHARGIVHRDIKPANVFLATDASGRIQPKLLDFGVAKQMGATSLTEDGTVIGTVMYMAPEQLEGAGSDERSDVWSFCVVLRELATGTRPFDGTNSFTLMRAVVESAPAPLPRDGGIDDALERVLARGMSKVAAERWPSMRELGQALAQWLIARGVNEDVCWSSLRATWLDGSAAPSGPSASAPATAPATAAELPLTDAAVRDDASSSGAARPAPASRPRSLLVLAATASVLALVGLVAMRRASVAPSPPASAESPGPAVPAVSSVAPASDASALAPSVASSSPAVSAGPSSAPASSGRIAVPEASLRAPRRGRPGPSSSAVSPATAIPSASSSPARPTENPFTL